MIGPACVLFSFFASAQNPTPSLDAEPGVVRLCNDDLGAIVWGMKEALTLSVGKSDIWDRRNPAPPEPVLTLDQMIEKAKAGDVSILNGAAYYSAYNAHDFPCPKPAGQVILQLPFTTPEGTVSLDQTPRDLRVEASCGAKQIRLRLYVSAVRNLIVIEAESIGLQPGDVTLRVYRHRDTIVPGGELHPTLGDKNSPHDFEQLPMPRAGEEQGLVWVGQDFGSDATFPKGFTSVLAAKAVDAPSSTSTVEGQTGLGTPMRAEKEGRISHGLTKRFTPINEAPGSAATARLDAIPERFHVIVTVATTQDDANPLARAQRDLAEAEKLGFDALRAEHDAQWDAYNAKPHARAWSADGSFKVDMPWGGVPYRVRPSGYYGDVPLCSVDSTKFCFQDSSMWHADFHFNEIDATVPCIERQFDMLDSYFRMILTLLPMAQSNARQVYGCAGAMYPLVHYPLKADTVIHSHLTWEQSMEITALLARPFWLRFLYSWDMDFLRAQAYPVLREGARFYAEYLHAGGDGLYHVFPTVSPEHRGITKDLEFNKDTQSSITLIRYHLRAAARAAELLGMDEQERGRWIEIAAKMPAYPTVDTPEGPIFIDVAGAQPMEYNIPVPLSAAFWGDDIGLDSPPEAIELARRTLKLIQVWEPHRGYLKRVRARLGIYEPGDGIALENLLQSHTGVIRVFPAVPPDFQGGFEKLGAQGAFVVAAKRAKEGVRTFTITSLAGNDCTVANPWKEVAPAVIDLETGKQIAVSRKAGILEFKTAAEHTYRIRPPRASSV